MKDKTKENVKIILLLVSIPYYLGINSLCFANDLTDSENIFNWAEKNYSQYFSPEGSQSSSILGYWARYYKTEVSQFLSGKSI